MFGHFWQFIWDVVRQWETLFYGLLGAVVVWGFLRAERRWPRTKWIAHPAWKYGAIALTVLFACFRTWEEQLIAAETARTELEATAKPKLTLDVHSHEAGKTEFGTTIVTLMVTVRNKGSSSICENFQFAVTLPSGSRIDGSRVSFPHDITMRDPVTRIIRTMKPIDSLQLKALAAPIERGGRVTGYLWYTFPGIPVKKLAVRGSRGSLTCFDIEERQVRIDFNDVGFGIKPAGTYPGLSTEIEFPEERTQ